MSRAYFFRFCEKDGKSFGGFKWPLEVGAIIEAPDADPAPVCGYGLHGFSIDSGNLGLVYRKGITLVFSCDEKDVIPLDGKVKVIGPCRIEWVKNGIRVAEAVAWIRNRLEMNLATRKRQFKQGLSSIFSNAAHSINVGDENIYSLGYKTINVTEGSFINSTGSKAVNVTKDSAALIKADGKDSISLALDVFSHVYSDVCILTGDRSMGVGNVVIALAKECTLKGNILISLYENCTFIRGENFQYAIANGRRVVVESRIESESDES